VLVILLQKAHATVSVLVRAVVQCNVGLGKANIMRRLSCCRSHRECMSREKKPAVRLEKTIVHLPSCYSTLPVPRKELCDSISAYKCKEKTQKQGTRPSAGTSRWPK